MNKFKGYGDEKQIFYLGDEVTGDRVTMWERERRGERAMRDELKGKGCTSLSLNHLFVFTAILGY